jgi:hypothetical protein
VITASNIQDELSDHISHISTGGIGALQLMAQKIGQVPWPSLPSPIAHAILALVRSQS